MIATELRREYGLNGRVAMRLARGWSQAEVATRWNARWPDEPKTFKSVSHWENWPSSSGYMPSLIILDRLARIYECAVGDLITDWGEHRADTGADGPDRAEADSTGALAWRIQHLALPQLTRDLSRWTPIGADVDQRALLLKLSTAAALAASALPQRTADDDRRPAAPHAELDDLTGRWLSRYSYGSSRRDAEREEVHEVELRAEREQLVGRSRPQASGSRLELRLDVRGSVATGTWTERTSPTGYYRAATYH